MVLAGSRHAPKKLSSNWELRSSFVEAPVCGINILAFIDRSTLATFITYKSTRVPHFSIGNMPSTMTGQVNPVKKPLDRLQDSESLYRRGQ